MRMAFWPLKRPLKFFVKSLWVFSFLAVQKLKKLVKLGWYVEKTCQFTWLFQAFLFLADFLSFLSLNGLLGTRWPQHNWLEVEVFFSASTAMCTATIKEPLVVLYCWHWSLKGGRVKAPAEPPSKFRKQRLFSEATTQPRGHTVHTNVVVVVAVQALDYFQLFSARDNKHYWELDLE